MKILAVTGSRSDYDLLQPLLEKVEAHSAFDLVLVATCAQLSHASGGTINRIAGFQHVLQRPTLLDWNTPEARIKSMGLELIGLAQDIETEKPDLILVLGDREDALLAAMAGQYSWVPVVHIFGGDQGWSTVDDSVRHAVSKLAHLHFPVSEASRQNLIALGENPARVHVCGNPALDRIRSHETWNQRQLEERFGILPDSPVILLTQHPLSPSPELAAQELRSILDACDGLDAQIVMNTPNSDPGSQASKDLIRDLKHVIPVCNVEQDAWVALLKRADLMLGNSSAGLLESAYLKIPAVNVGDRQRDREHAGNVDFVPVEKGSIRVAVHRALFDEDYRAKVQGLPCPFGDGRSAESIMTILESLNPKMLMPKEHRLQGGSK
jgi:GDP/UDP-N,N'-diacetylbacillosamine 2-epimerase (hydrolysing)